ncbi:hypothetical protein ACLOJK_028706 [Asimina triloba]
MCGDSGGSGPSVYRLAGKKEEEDWQETETESEILKQETESEYHPQAGRCSFFLLHKLLQILQQLYYGWQLVITAAHESDDHETPLLAGGQVLPPPQAPEAGGQIRPLPPQASEGVSDGQEPDEAEQRRKIKGKEPLVASDDDDDDEEEIDVFPFQRDIASTSGTKNPDDAGKEEEEEIAPTMPGNSSAGTGRCAAQPQFCIRPIARERSRSQEMTHLLFEEYQPRLNDIW